MVRITDLCDKTIERLRALHLDVDPAGDVNPVTVDMIVRQTVLALGFAINDKTGRIYDPAREDDVLAIETNPAKQRQQAIYAGMPSRRGRAKRYR